MIYFIQAEIGGPIKIGYTRSISPAARVASLQSGCPFPLRVIHTMAGSQLDEQALHVRFATLRLHGEWFSDKDPLAGWLAHELKAIVLRPAPQGPLSALQGAVLEVLPVDRHDWLLAREVVSLTGLPLRDVVMALRALRDRWKRATSRRTYIPRDSSFGQPMQEWQRSRVMQT